MLTTYLARNYMTLMILFALAVILYVNRKDAKFPGAKYYSAGMLLLLLITVVDTVEFQLSLLPLASQAQIRLRACAAAASNILLPLIIMIEVFYTAPGKTSRWLIAIPGAINTLIYGSVFFGSSAAFFIDSGNHWGRGPLGYSIYFTLMFYVFMLALFSILYNRWGVEKRSAMILLIVLQSVAAAFLEYFNIVTGVTNPVIALCMLEYYFYLSVIYQQEMRDLITEKELYITKQKMDLLRSQIHPHFIFNSLSVIRALSKRDGKKAVACIDSFSEYLKAHIKVLQEDDLIPFSDELDNIRAYLELVQADATRKLTVNYDLQCTDFLLPPLSLEPIVENAIKHGVGRQGGTITIQSQAAGSDVRIRVSDSGSPEGGMTEQEAERLGVGLDNTRKRLRMQCRGTLEMQLSDSGAVVTVTLPDALIPEGPSADPC